MIKLENLTFTIGEDTFGGVLTAPSVVLTSTPQEEELDLTKSPNFQITINDKGNFTDTVEVSFTAEEVQYTANMKVVNRNGDYVTLQYVDGLEQGETPEPVPSITSISFDKFNQLTDNEKIGSFSQYTGVDEVILDFAATEANSSFSDDIKACGIASVSDNEGNDITSDCTFSSNDWIKELVDEENNEYAWVYKRSIGEDDKNTEYSIVITASYTTSDSRTLTDNITLKYTLTSEGTEPEPEEPSYSVKIFNRYGDSEVSLPWNYDLSGQNPTDSLNLDNASRTLPSTGSYSVKVFDNNTGNEVELTENNLSMTSSNSGKSLVYWNSQYNIYTLDLQNSQSQGLTAEDFLGDVTITVNDVQQTISLPIIPPYIGTSFAEIYSVTVGAQMIINLEGGNNKMYLVDAYAPGGTGGTYYKDIIVNDGQGNSMLIYNTDSNVADTTNFSTRPDTDFTGQSFTCQEMLSNGNRIKWIAGTIQTFRNGYQIQSSNLPAFTLDSNSTVSVDILYPENTSISSINRSNRYPIKIEAGTISASGANGSVEFTDKERGETITINIYRVDTSTSTDTYNGMVCILTGIYNALGNVIDWTSLTSNA